VDLLARPAPGAVEWDALADGSTGLTPRMRDAALGSLARDEPRVVTRSRAAAAAVVAAPGRILPVNARRVSKGLKKTE
jgi:hypothetical protein